MNIVNCERCGERCQAVASRNPKAKMLRHSDKGLCVNCAVHDWLRNTYPPNILLAQSGPKALLIPHIQQQFAEIMRVGFADAKPDEIDWQKMVDNWELPFPHKVKSRAMNPCNQMDEIASGKRPGLGQSMTSVKAPSCLTITSFEQLNKLQPRLGDEFKKTLRQE